MTEPDRLEPEERGSRDRDSLFLLAKLKPLQGGAEMAVRVRNLSPGGVMAELPEALDPDASIAIELRGIGWVHGRVAWYTEGRVGIAFDREIDPQRARKPVGRDASMTTT